MMKPGSRRRPFRWHLFVSYASEDKAAVGRPLFEALASSGAKVWFDEAEIFAGDSLRARIDDGLSRSRFGVVILSESFFRRPWPKRELAALVGRNAPIIPIWHGIDEERVRSYSPMLADQFALTTDSGVDTLAAQIIEAMRRAGVRLRRPAKPRPPNLTHELLILVHETSRSQAAIEPDSFLAMLEIRLPPRTNTQRLLANAFEEGLVTLERVLNKSRYALIQRGRELLTQLSRMNTL